MYKLQKACKFYIIGINISFTTFFLKYKKSLGLLVIFLSFTHKATVFELENVQR